jgi:endoglucanase
VTQDFTHRVGFWTAMLIASSLVACTQNQSPSSLESRLSAQATSLVFADGLSSNWQDWKWGTSTTADTSLKYTGSTSLKATFNQAWAGLKFHAVQPLVGASSLNYWVYGDAPLRLLCYRNGVQTPGKTARGVANTWTQVVLSLSDCGSPSAIDEFALQLEGSAPRTVYLDDVRFAGSTASPPPSPPPSDTGLLATYYANVGLTGTPITTRTDAEVNFDWGSGSPAAGVPADNFSARWQGELIVPRDGRYTFVTQSDDGVRLNVAGTPVIANWTDHAPNRDAGGLDLRAGRVPITLEYYERAGGAVMRLLWSGPGISESPVPSSALVPKQNVTPPPPPPPAPPGTGYTVQSGRFFNGTREFKLYGINWFGLETPSSNGNNLHGLWTGRTIPEFVDQMAGLGFNAWRIPVSPDSIRPGKSASSWGAYTNKTGREILEEFLRVAQSRNMFVLLDFHTYDPQQLGPALPGRPFPTSGSYTKADWLADLRALADLGKRFSNVVGVDLVNEPHLLNWAEWAPLAAEGGRAVLETNPNLLVFVEGVGNKDNDNGGFNPFWGENLARAGDLSGIPGNKLVYSPHTYGPVVFNQPFFSASNFPSNMPAIWDSHFGHLVGKGYTLAIGEFGGPYGSQNRVWLDAFTNYLVAKPISAFFFWSMNPNSGDTGGLLLDDWRTVDQGKLSVLKKLMR